MFTSDQIAMLDAKLSSDNVKTRQQSGRNLSYLESWVVISEANRIFGFGNWNRETVELRCVSEKERAIGSSGAQGWGVTYIARVRVTVHGADGRAVVREGCGSGHGIDRDLGQAHESALKEAESDAGKRAFMTFGNPFGLALYDKTQANVESGPAPVTVRQTAPNGQPDRFSVAPSPDTAKPQGSPVARSEPPVRQPAPPAGNVSREVASRAAKTWGENALILIRGFMKVDALNAWVENKTNQEALSRVYNYDTELHQKVNRAIKDKYDTFNAAIQ